MLVFTTSGISTAPNLSALRRDPLLSGDNGGVLYISDFAFPWSYSPGAPTSGKIIRDLSEQRDGTYLLTGGQTVTHAGGGLDYSAATVKNNVELIPASALAAVFAQQYFLFSAYFKLPAKADWKTEGGMCALVQSSPSDNGFQATPDLLTIGMAAPNILRFYRQRDATNQDANFLTVDDSQFGTVCQVAYWRNAAGKGARIRNAGTTVLQTGAAGTNNTQDFSGQTLKIGMPPGFWGSPLAGSDLNARKYRHYRTFLENLAVSGRDPVAVLDADLARVLTRNAFK